MYYDYEEMLEEITQGFTQWSKYAKNYSDPEAHESFQRYTNNLKQSIKLLIKRSKFESRDPELQLKYVVRHLQIQKQAQRYLGKIGAFERKCKKEREQQQQQSTAETSEGDTHEAA